VTDDGQGEEGDHGLRTYDREAVAGAGAGTGDAARDGVSAPTVVGVLLAGGTSSRFGEANKLLAELDGEPLVGHAARTLLDAGLVGVIAVLGHEADAVGAALGSLEVSAVRNDDYETGLSTSVARGVEAAEAADADAAVFLPGDMPGVAPGTADLLVDAYRAGLGTALAAAHEGRRGNPVLFDREHFGRLRALEGDVGGRSVLLGSDGAALVEAGDPGVVEDVDTVEDLRRRR
jgi:molybdenum cofactor cytidylyltransferase